MGGSYLDGCELKDFLSLSVFSFFIASFYRP